MKKMFFIVLAFLLILPAYSVFAASVKTIDKDELKAMLDSGDIVVLDVRRGRDWSSSEFKITGAQRLAEDEIAQAIAEMPKEKKLVFYCA